MKSPRAYLVNALIAWILENDCTPHIVLDVSVEGVVVPPSYVRDGKIVLNVAPSAVRNFHLDSFELVFDSRFGGVSKRISAPTGAIVGVFARENQQGMWFEPEDSTKDANPAVDSTPPSSKTSAKVHPFLKVVK